MSYKSIASTREENSEESASENNTIIVDFIEMTDKVTGKTKSMMQLQFVSENSEND